MKYYLLSYDCFDTALNLPSGKLGERKFISNEIGALFMDKDYAVKRGNEVAPTFNGQLDIPTEPIRIFREFVPKVTEVMLLEEKK